MSTKILSQSEIDSLLSSLEEAPPSGTVGTQARKVKPYDFRRPDKFSKDHIRALQTVFENFARLVSYSLTSYVRGRVEIHASSVEQVIYEEYVSELPEPTIIGIVSMDPLPDRAIVEMNMSIFSVVFDRLLGGTGEQVREITELRDIENIVLRGLFSNILSIFKESWAGILDVKPNLEEVVLSPQYVQSALLGGVAILTVLEISIFNHSGTMTICIPHTVLEPIMSKLNTQTWLSGLQKKPTKSLTEVLADQLGNVTIPATVELGQATLAFGDLMNLQPSDIICLDSPIGQELKVIIGKDVKFSAVPGVVGNKTAVRVTRVWGDEVQHEPPTS